MKYRNLGNTGLSVSEIGLGCEGFISGGTPLTCQLLDLAEKSGVNYIDLYSSDPDMRASLSVALKGRREKFLLQSHLCAIWDNGQYKRTRNLQQVKSSFEESLVQLGTDYIDVGMIHYCDNMDDWQAILDNGILAYARQLKADGVIKHIGLSSHNPLVSLKAVESGEIEVLMFSANPCYDLMPAGDNVEDLWADEKYENTLVNMDPDREKLYETCQRLGVGITVMKAFGGGDLLSEELSPAGKALTVNQCLHYALTRPAVCVVNCGSRALSEFEACLAYENATDEEKDYAKAFADFPKIKWDGHCMYCGHCAPCPVGIDVASLTKFLNLAKAQGSVPETVREHYGLLKHTASECIGCGACEKRCPFNVKIIDNMKLAAKIFNK